MRQHPVAIITHNGFIEILVSKYLLESAAPSWQFPLSRVDTAGKHSTEEKHMIHDTEGGDKRVPFREFKDCATSNSGN